MLMDVLAACGLLLCLLGLAHGWLPAHRRQRVNAHLQKVGQWLRRQPAALRSLWASRQANVHTRQVIQRAQRVPTRGAEQPGTVHDLAAFRRQRQAADDEQQTRH